MSSALKIKPAGSPTQSLEELRAQIDQIDKSLIELFEKRASLVSSVGSYKAAHQIPAFDPSREEQIKLNIKSLTSSSSPISISEMESLFMNLVSHFRNYESVHMQREQAKDLFEKSDLNFKKVQKVVILGFGLLGSSLYLALNDFLPHWEFLIIDPYLKKDDFLNWREKNQFKNIQLANTQPVGHPVDQSTDQSVDKGNIYILAAPVEANIKHLTTFAFPPESLVFDLGSTKKIMCDTYLERQKSENVSFTFVGGHPLAGKGRSGFEHGDALLFYNKVFCWVTVPFQVMTPSLKTTFDIFAMGLGAHPYWIDPEEHDSALAWTSHLPQIISSAMASCLNNQTFSSHPDLFPGFIRDLLRASSSSFSMWESIFSSNTTHVSAALSDFILNLKEIENNLNEPQLCKKIFQESNNFYNQFQDLIKKRESQ